MATLSESPPLPLLLLDNEWLPPPPFRGSFGLQRHPFDRLGTGLCGPAAGLAADWIYALVDELIVAFHAQLSTVGL